MKGTPILIIGMLLAAPVVTGCEPTAVEIPTPTPVSLATISAGDSERTLNVGGLARTYLLHIPPGLDAHTAAPLLIVFHGYRMNGVYMVLMTGLNELADSIGFIAVYPEGTGLTDTLSWNAGICCGAAVKNAIDDVAFVRGIIADLRGTAGVDSKRIYAAGYSNGALFSYRLACEMSDVFAAVAPVAGNITSLPCEPEQPVSIIHIQGDEDTAAPFDAEDVPPDRVDKVLSVKQSIAFWAGIDGCPDAPQTEQDGTVGHTIYSSCTRGASVELFVVQGIGHSWPPASYFPTSQRIWDFFSSHPKPYTR
jgi:polyhydroxybutyrate depolymerase